MRRKQLRIVIVALITLNCFTVFYFQSKGNKANGQEVVASVGKSEISRQQWLDELETRYGRDVLKDIIDQKVIEEMADKYKIKVSEQDVDREFRLLQTTYSSPGENNNTSEKKWKEQIRNSLLQEEILTRDVVVSDKEMKSYYQKNQEIFNIPTAYHLSQIVVKTMAEAKKVLNELSQGSSFSTLAMERSIEEFSANQGGDIGYLIEGEERYPIEYIQTAKRLKDGAWSDDPIKVDQGYAIVKLDEKVKGKNYSFKDVKSQIRRQIALEQMGTTATAATFWKEAKVEWFYGNKNAQ